MQGRQSDKAATHSVIRDSAAGESRRVAEAPAITSLCQPAGRKTRGIAPLSGAFLDLQQLLFTPH